MRDDNWKKPRRRVRWRSALLILTGVASLSTAGMETFELTHRPHTTEVQRTETSRPLHLEEAVELDLKNPIVAKELADCAQLIRISLGDALADVQPVRGNRGPEQDRTEIDFAVKSQSKLTIKTARCSKKKMNVYVSFSETAD